jgi:hypothetical protein
MQMVLDVLRPRRQQSLKAQTISGKQGASCFLKAF